MKNVLTLVLCFLGWTAAIRECYGDGWCWVVTSAGSCASHFGQRVPDFGCNGCNIVNGTSLCVNYQNATRSLPDPFWGQDFVIGDHTDDWADKSYEIVFGYTNCAEQFNCFPSCYFSFETGGMTCFKQTTFWVWNFEADTIIRRCGVKT